MCDIQPSVISDAEKRLNDLNVDPVGTFRKKAAEEAAKAAEEAAKQDPNYRPKSGAPKASAAPYIGPGRSLSEKPDKDKIKELVEKLNPSQNYYKVGNYIVRTGNGTIPHKKATFLLSGGVYLSKLKACITNMSTVIHATIEGESKSKLDK